MLVSLAGSRGAGRRRRRARWLRRGGNFGLYRFPSCIIAGGKAERQKRRSRQSRDGGPHPFHVTNRAKQGQRFQATVHPVGHPTLPVPPEFESINTKRAARFREPPESFPNRGLQRVDVGSLQALRATHDFELNGLAVVQGLVTLRLDRGKMYEYIFPGLALDETKALAGVKPLHCSLFFAHFVVLFSLIKLSGAPQTGTKLPPTRSRRLGSGRLQLRFFVSAVRAQKKAASLTRDRFTTSKAIQEQQTQKKNSRQRDGLQEVS